MQTRHASSMGHPTRSWPPTGDDGPGTRCFRGSTRRGRRPLQFAARAEEMLTSAQLHPGFAGRRNTKARPGLRDCSNCLAG